MTRTAVTGGSGRLGRSVVRALVDAGHSVLSLDRTPVPGLPAEQTVIDLTDAGATRAALSQWRPDAVIHLAAISVPFSAPDAETFATNTALAFSVLEGALDSGARAILVASSPTVIGYGSPSGWGPAYLPIDEAHPLAPWNGYSLSKQAIEEIVAMMVRVRGEEARFGVFRPCYVISPEEWAGAPTQQGHTVKERLDSPELSAVALFNYLDARDAGGFVLAWLSAADRTPNGSCFFVGAPDSLVRGDVSGALSELVSGTADAARALKPSDPVFSSRAAEELLGWHAQHTWRNELCRREPDHGRPDRPVDAGIATEGREA